MTALLIGPDTDRPTAIAELAAEFIARRLRRGDSSTSEQATAFAATRLRAAFAAADAGHTVTWDPPSGATSRERWTCVSRPCSAAVLSDHQGENLTGSALARQCEGRSA